MFKNLGFVLRRPYKIQEKCVAKINGFLMSKCLKPAFWLILFAYVDYQVLFHEHGGHVIIGKNQCFETACFFASPATGFCFGGVFFSVLSERIFVQSFACSSEQVSVTRQPSPLPLHDVY